MPDTSPVSDTGTAPVLEEQRPPTPTPAPDAHMLTILDPLDDDWQLRCPLDPADTTKRCWKIVECGCSHAELGTPCPNEPNAGPHRRGLDGTWGVFEPGCWLRECDDIGHAVAALKLPTGHYLVRDVGRELPELELLGTFSPA